MTSVLVVGAGISGMAASRELLAAGIDLTVVDRGHRIGGRMASRRTAGRVADIGASYFTVSDPEFEAVVSDWHRRGLARPWTDTFLSISPAGQVTKTGPQRWAAVGGLRSLVEDLASGLDIERRTVAAINPPREVDGRRYDAIALAMPDPQARRLLDPGCADELEALDDPFEPALALTATWRARSWAQFDGAFLDADAALSWIADDGQRRGDGAPVLVAHSTPALARRHLADPGAAIPELVAAVRAALDIPTDPETAEVDRWTFAKPAARRRAAFFLGDQLIGLCGDSWSERPRVEAAFLSGRALGQALVRRLTAPPLNSTL